MLSREWKKSSYSGGSNDCVEARLGADGGVEVRDSKAPELGSLKFTPSEWDAFTAGVKAGQFRIPGPEQS
ncbi:DUF397 domain-containing protein [Prauserella cavernicola]|uniref:DUF397 domain-containing protein n=1 Tax=Prauserella cavernicola TaxID=2800127 RepID=A0A934V4N1_9PSEU|nr:DUF397 domain-containing protein [Prauserella cavernicola]MBK1785592.1 DUF397 domain-containing protein [Prauserella cavernicola]